MFKKLTKAMAPMVAKAAAKASPSSAPTGGMRGIGKQVAGAVGRMRFKEGGAVSSGRGDGIAVRGKTKCKMS
jgi:hypothetical protein